MSYAKIVLFKENHKYFFNIENERTFTKSKGFWFYRNALKEAHLKAKAMKVRLVEI